MTVSVRTRFEVFKRDRFTCSYCGRTPPEVLLHVDHIVPVAAGGSDELHNLTTACATCNGGKAARLLEEGTAPVVGKATVEQLAERVEQAKAYMELLGGLESVVDRQVQMVFDAWAKAFGAELVEEDTGTVWRFDSGYGELWPNEHSIRRFLRHLTLEDVIEAVSIAASRMAGACGTPATRYFYGVCNRAIKEGRAVGSLPAKASTEEYTERDYQMFNAGVAFENKRIGDLFRDYMKQGWQSPTTLVEILWGDDE